MAEVGMPNLHSTKKNRKDKKQKTKKTHFGFPTKGRTQKENSSTCLIMGGYTIP
jgi:hypothetical protein